MCKSKHERKRVGEVRRRERIRESAREKEKNRD